LPTVTFDGFPSLTAFRNHIMRAAPEGILCLWLGITLAGWTAEPEILLPPAPPPAMQKQIAGWMQSVVKITQHGRDGEEGLGAGWIVDSQGLIVTNLHVIGRGRRLEVMTKGGDRYEVTDIHAWDEHSDLAILKVKQKGLPALKLGDSSEAQQGEPVSALGNPQGLEFSVVQGVLSGKRDIDDVEMLQVALPIERGNSGGPLLNSQGEVLGVITLKSMKTENLGFAIPSSAVKALLEEPNSIPINRWMTIGVLDPRTWLTVGEGAWSQRAGLLKSAGLGQGFGGRTLAVWQTLTPQEPYEVSVNVRLSDESGAAGLIFASDNKDLHYGFYPSNGQMRLTRFEGPDVYSWTVIAQESSTAYKPEEWNHLRVRVEKGRISCWVNGELWRTVVDDGFRGGRAGLCRFRAPEAEFKGFRVGKDLAEKTPSPEMMTQLRVSVDAFAKGQTGLSATAFTLGRQPSTTTGKVLEEEARSLEEKAAAIRKLRLAVHQAALATELQALLHQPEEEASLLRAALLLAQHDNPDLDPALSEELVQRMVAELKNDKEIAQKGLPALQRINRYFFAENGFHVPRNSDSPSNSYINEVLDDREGLPIMLSTLYLELAQRLGIKGCFGLALPVRFMVGYREPDPDSDLVIFDMVQDGKQITLEQAATAIGAEDGEDLSSFTKPATKRDMILRMIANLMGRVAPDEPPSDDQASYLSLQIAIQDHAPGERVMRAIYRAKTGDKSGAQDDIQWLMKNTGGLLDEARMRELQNWYDSLE
jgi:regulator of sirC expression with transglutaminase-like and TPR domain